MKYVKPVRTYLGSVTSSVQGAKTGAKTFQVTESAMPASTTAGAYEVDE
jgi:hypothetical protein